MTLAPRIALLGLLFGLLAAAHAAPAGHTAECRDPATIRFSLVPKKDVARQLHEYRPLLQMLQRRLGRRVEAIQPASYGNVIEGLLAGGIDLAELGPAAYAITKERDPAVSAFAALASHRGHHSEAGASYRALLIVRSDGPLQRLADLEGASLTLTDPASTSGAIFPHHLFSKLIGAPLEAHFGRISYSGSHDRSIEAVGKGLADAAFVSSRRLDEAIDDGTLRPGDMRVLWRSAPIPYDPFVLGGRLCEPLADKIRSAFLDHDGALAGMFAELKAQGFVAVGDDDYREVREILAAPR